MPRTVMTPRTLTEAEKKLEELKAQIAAQQAEVAERARQLEEDARAAENEKQRQKRLSVVRVEADSYLGADPHTFDGGDGHLPGMARLARINYEEMRNLASMLEATNQGQLPALANEQRRLNVSVRGLKRTVIAIVLLFSILALAGCAVVIYRNLDSNGGFLADERIRTQNISLSTENAKLSQENERLKAGRKPSQGSLSVRCKGASKVDGDDVLGRNCTIENW